MTVDECVRLSDHIHPDRRLVELGVDSFAHVDSVHTAMRVAFGCVLCAPEAANDEAFGVDA